MHSSKRGKDTKKRGDLAEGSFSRSHSFPLCGLMSLAFAVILVSGNFARAETFNEKCEKIKDQLGKTGCQKFMEFSQKLAEFMKIRAEVEHLEISVRAGYNGDMARNNQRELINLESTINKTVYPAEFRFSAGALFSTKNSESQDQVTSFLVNLDYNVSRRLKTYGFFERFTDTFMNIKERYETGAGAKLEFEFFDPTERTSGKDDDKASRERRALEGLPGVICELECFLKTNAGLLDDEKIDGNDLRGFLDVLGTEVQRMEQILRKNRTKLNLGLAMTAMSEMEQASDLSISVLDSNLKLVTTTTYPFAPTQRFRFVLRPTIEFKVNDYLSLYGHIYFKLPLGRPLYYPPVNGNLDWRYDARCYAKFDFLKDTSWGGAASVIVEYERHYDNAPPRVSDQFIGQYLSRDETLSRTAANNTHQTVMVKVEVKF